MITEKNRCLVFTIPVHLRSQYASKKDSLESVIEQDGSNMPYQFFDEKAAAMLYSDVMKKQGYDVLNLIEIRKKRKNEEVNSKVNVNEHKFNY